MDDKKRLQELDRRFIWHPFTQMKDWQAEDPLIITEGNGCFIRDRDGRWYLDGVSSLWVNIHGHRRRELDEAIKAQIDRISHSTLLGMANAPSIELAGRLAELLRQSGMAGLTKIFYSDNGSTAVEVALKMAFQYWRHRGDSGRNAFVSLNNAYHGDTLGAMSVGGIPIFHDTFRPLLFHTFKAPAPYCYRCELGAEPVHCGMACLEKMDNVLQEHHQEIAAVIVEPLVQAAGGMIIWPEGFLRGVRGLCDRYGLLMIADEVATGFGRTGRMFACEHEAVAPDIICLSKGITGGYLPLAVTVATDNIYNAFLGEFSELKTFFHGHSYTGNPLGCAAAVACLGIFEQEDTTGRLPPKIKLLRERLEGMSSHPHVGDVRNKGLMAGIELVRDKKTKEPYPWERKMGWEVSRYAREKGVLIRPLGNVVVVMPPLSIAEDDLARMLDVIHDGIEAVT
ncbi:MAG: adenosylmethionine--8-amino-7-oxononanoate transaminase [Nitrospiraceae bacterium]|nr:adenosylmethionine--8-amino-7-oxononanoate transaminase [Nitrospiraceae bacterium]